MNISQFFREVAEKFNADERCGFCWDFKKVKGESGMNTIRLTDDDKCCVQLINTYERKLYSERWNAVTTTVKEQFCDNHFVIYAVKTANLGTNFGNEIPGHDEAESISNTIVQPLFDCLTCGNILDVCEFGYNFGIIQWISEEVLFLGDQNFSGIKITGIFRENVY